MCFACIIGMCMCMYNSMAHFMGKKSLGKSNLNKGNRLKKSIEFYNRSNISIKFFHQSNLHSIEFFHLSKFSIDRILQLIQIFDRWNISLDRIYRMIDRSIDANIIDGNQKINPHYQDSNTIYALWTP